MVTIEITADTADEAMEALRALAREEGPTVADKVDERLVELKELGAFDPPKCRATRGTCEGPRLGPPMETNIRERVEESLVGFIEFVVQKEKKGAATSDELSVLAEVAWVLMSC